MANEFKKQPLRPNQIASTFSKYRTSAYHDTATSRGPSTSVAGVTPPHFLRTLAWSPLGNLIATGTGDRKLRVWNPERANVKHSTELRGHTGAVERVAWNPMREAELASVSVDGSVRIWDVRSGKNIADIKTLGKEGFSLAWRPDGSEMVVGTKVYLSMAFEQKTNSL
jgi:THO complex subunit 3